MRYSLRRDQRLLGSREFQTVFRRSRRAADALFLVCAHYTSGPARLGLAISRKHARRAVDRNRIKRHAREAFRQLAPELAPADYVIVNRPGATTASPAALRDSLRARLMEVGANSGRRRRRDSA